MVPQGVHGKSLIISKNKEKCTPYPYFLTIRINIYIHILYI